MSGDNNFILIELSYYSELVRSKAKLEAIIDSLLEGNIPNYSRHDANRISNLYFDSRFGIKKDEVENYKDVKPKEQLKKEGE